MQRKMNQTTDKEFSMIATYGNPSLDTNKLIKKYFGNEINVKYPSVLFFQVQNSNVSDYRLIQLDQKEYQLLSALIAKLSKS